MFFGFANLAMLIGLTAVGLPVIAHLLSKRKFDVVQWGAMQFLELGKKTRQRIRLQDLLLLLLRMLLVGLVALALARPWGQGGVFGQLSNAVSRDVVFVIDSSYSTAWEGKAVTPRAAAIDWVHKAIEDLQPGDTVALIDARTQNRQLVVPPVTDMKHVREVLNALSEPSGTSDLSSALTEAMQILSTTSNNSREVIVLTDGQALPWKLEDAVTWERIKELQEQPAIPPKLYVVSVGSELKDLTNFSVDRIELSRGMTVPDFPIRIRTTVRQSGGESTQRNVHFEVDGQRLPSQATQISILPNGEALVEFEHRFEAIGSYVVSVTLDDDNLAADNRADAVVLVADGIPVLLVDGDHHLDPIRRETFFLKSAFDSTGQTRWVNATVVRPEQLPQTDFSGYRVVYLCNLTELAPEVLPKLAEFVSTGGALVIAPGDRVDEQKWNALELAEGLPFLPLDFKRIGDEKSVKGALVTVDHQSLQLPWLERFRKERGIDFADSRFGKWWELAPRERQAENAADQPEATVEMNPSRTLATLTTGDPLLASRAWGEGQIIELAFPLDADWSTLPARNDFVPFVHEMVFALTNSGPGRNVDVGSGLVFELPKDEQATNWVISGPDTEEAAVIPIEIGQTPAVSFAEAKLSGTYFFHLRGAAPQTGEPFVVDFDRAESNLKPLDDADWATLTDNGPLSHVESMEDLTMQLKHENSRTELWWLLLFGVLALLVCEVALTRQMVKGGHTALDAEPLPA